MEWRKLADYLYPPRCPVCDARSAEGICGSCEKKLYRISEPYCMICGSPLEDARSEICTGCLRRRHAFVRGRALFSYQGEICRSLYRMKYANRREYAAVYGVQMAWALGGWIFSIGIDRIVPIPLHPSRRRRRGYNQAALLARSMGRELGLPVEEHLLVRVQRTSPQKSLSEQERRANLAGAFAVCVPPVAEERILLVDDIFTTGSTADAAAKCLLAAGCGSVYVAACAIA